MESITHKMELERRQGELMDLKIRQYKKDIENKKAELKGVYIQQKTNVKD